MEHASLVDSDNRNSSKPTPEFRYCLAHLNGHLNCVYLDLDDVCHFKS